MKFQVRAKDDTGDILGSVDAESHYEAAVKASTKFFKHARLPHRETGWAGHAGVFWTQLDDGGRGKPYYVRELP